MKTLLEILEQREQTGCSMHTIAPDVLHLVRHMNIVGYCDQVAEVKRHGYSEDGPVVKLGFLMYED